MNAAVAATTHATASTIFAAYASSSYAVSRDPLRRELRALHAEHINGHAFSVTCDGHRLTVRPFTAPAGFFGDACTRTLRLPDVRPTNETKLLACPNAETSFPDWRAVLVKKYTAFATFDRKAMLVALTAVRRAATAHATQLRAKAVVEHQVAVRAAKDAQAHYTAVRKDRSRVPNTLHEAKTAAQKTKDAAAVCWAKIPKVGEPAPVARITQGDGCVWVAPDFHDAADPSGTHRVPSSGRLGTTLGLNVNYLRDALSAHTTPHIELHTVDNFHPVRLQTDDAVGAYDVIMPVWLGR